MQSSETLLDVRGVSKKFCRNLHLSFNYGLRDLGRQALGVDRRTERLRAKEFWAVKGVTFSLKKGESVGIVGPNGAGKTTLLKIIGGLIKPDGGSVVVRGRIVPLFAQGAGFNKVLTGRENITLNLLLLGLRPEEIPERLQAIFDFAEQEAAVLDAPLKTYSMGMAARLGFACAVQANADVLLVDEALAVGDMRFRAKCYRRLNELRLNGTSVVMVSHSINAINNNTDRSIYLREGRVILDDSTSAVTTLYEDDQLFSSYFTDELSRLSSDIVLSGEDGVPRKTIATGQTLRVRVRLQAGFEAAEARITFEEIPRNLGVVFDKSFSLPASASGDVLLELPELGLVGGVYCVHALVTARDGRSKQESSTGLRVTSPSEISQNIFFQPVTWSACRVEPQPNPK